MYGVQVPEETLRKVKNQMIDTLEGTTLSLIDFQGLPANVSIIEMYEYIELMSETGYKEHKDVFDYILRRNSCFRQYDSIVNYNSH